MMGAINTAPFHGLAPGTLRIVPEKSGTRKVGPGVWRITWTFACRASGWRPKALPAPPRRLALPGPVALATSDAS